MYLVIPVASVTSWTSWRKVLDVDTQMHIRNACQTGCRLLRGILCVCGPGPPVPLTPMCRVSSHLRRRRTDFNNLLHHHGRHLAKASKYRDPTGAVPFSLRIVGFNVQTLLDKKPGTSGPDATEVGTRLLGRKAALKDMLAEHCPHIVGLQETRLPETAAQADTDYLIYNAQADVRGGGGCAFWLSEVHPYAYRSNSPLRFSKEHVTVVTCSSRHITANVQTPVLRLYILVVHAPSMYNAAKQEISDFWQARARELEKRPDGAAFVLLADANARLGDTVSECVGDLAAEEELLAGNLFHIFLLQVGAFAPSTFPSCHKGPSGTW